MKYHDLLQLYFDRSNALQWYWTLYVVVLGGLLAFSSLRQRPDHRTAVLVTILYCCFAYKNLGAIGDVTHQPLAGDPGYDHPRAMRLRIRRVVTERQHPVDARSRRPTKACGISMSDVTC